MSAATTQNLPLDFDPWYVMLSPPEDIEEEKFSVVPCDTPVVERPVDYPGVVREAERNARAYIRERWNSVKSSSPADQITALLTSKRYRAGPLTARERFGETVACSLAAGGPVEFVLPSFPFKIPNSAKVQHRNADYAEILCLQRMYEITEIVRELGGTDSIFRIISDGKIYADICGVSFSERARYFRTVTDCISAMSAAHALQIVDMLDDVVAEQQPGLWREIETFRPALTDWWNSTRGDSKVRYLIRNMAANINLDAEMSAFTRAVVGAGDGFAVSLDMRARAEIMDEFVKQVHTRAEKAAFEFTALLVALRKTNAVETRYPGSIRATVHPKEGQWGIHLVNKESRVFPWQGVALQTLSGEWRIVPQSQALQRASVLVVDDKRKDPMYYSERPGA
jgi:L-tyrosine isonitrile synthase